MLTNAPLSMQHLGKMYRDDIDRINPQSIAKQLTKGIKMDQAEKLRKWLGNKE